MSEMDDLRSFVEVMRGGGYSRAARQLGLSKSIISRRIARLEAGLGTRLLDRTTRGMSPTDAGSELWVRAERILADYEEARDVVAKRGGGIVGPLRLAAPLAFGLRHIAPIVTDMAALHPGLELDVSYSDKFVDLIEERFDAAIRIGNLRDSSLVARRLAPARSVIVASPDYLDRKGRPKVPRDLSEHECLEYFGRMASEWRFRDGEVRIGAAGKIISAFDIARAIALGADWCNAARGYMFAIGCIQAQACHTNNCPVGIATQDKLRQRAVDVGDKSERVARFHRNTMRALGEIAGAAGLSHPSDFMPYHFMFRQKDNEFFDGNEVYPYLPEGFLVSGEELPELADWYSRWDRASAESFAPPLIPHGPFERRASA